MNYEKARDILLKAIGLCELIDDDYRLTQLLNELANVYLYLENIKLSTDTRERALQIANTISDQRLKAYILNDIGLYYSKYEKDYEEANRRLKKSYLILKDVGTNREAFTAAINIADNFIKMNKPDSAVLFVIPNIEMAKDQKLNKVLMEFYSLMSIIKTEKRDFISANKYLKEYISIKDTVYNIERTKQIAEMQSKYEAAEKEKEIQQLVYEQKIQSQKEKTFLIVISFIVFITVIIIIGLFIRRKKDKQIHMQKIVFHEKEKAMADIELEKSRILENELRKENEYKSKQLTTHALNMLQKNKLLQELDRDLKVFAPKADDKLTKSLNTIRRQIKKNMNTENDWNLFKLYFEEVNEDFFKSLQENYENITINDLKLAALIKLNLNIKEAAAVLNIEPDSLKRARYRLRQKLGLKTGESLSGFIGNM